MACEVSNRKRRAESPSKYLISYDYEVRSETEVRSSNGSRMFESTSRRTYYPSDGRPDSRHLRGEEYERRSSSRPKSKSSRRVKWRQSQSPSPHRDDGFELPDAGNTTYTLTSQVPYAAWKERLYQELEELNCLFAVEPTAKKKANMAEEDELKYRSLAKAIISMRVDDEHLALVDSVEDPLEAMQRLNRFREPNLRAMEARAEKQLAALVYDPNVPLDKFLHSFEGLVLEVEKYSGARLSDHKLKQRLLSAIIGEFPHIMSGPNASSASFGYRDLKELLREAVERRTASKPRGAVDQQTESDKRIQGDKDAHAHQGVKEISCTKCGAYGHVFTDCQRADKRRKCYSCLKFVDDHVASTCPEKKDDYPILSKILPTMKNGRFTMEPVRDDSKFASSLNQRPPSFAQQRQAEDRPGMELEEEDDDDLPLVEGMRQVYHIRRRLETTKLKAGRVARKDLIFTDSDFYTDIEYREMFIEENEEEPGDIILETIKVMSTKQN